MPARKLKLFYEEPELDRWLYLDRYPRRIIRRVVRGAPQVGGVQRWFVNLCAGLDRLSAAYDVNDYSHFKKHPGDLAIVIGKSHVISKIPDGTPIMYGPGVDSHPCANDFWRHANIRSLVISFEWFGRMYERDLPVKIPIRIWPAGIQTEEWKPGPGSGQGSKVIVYDKIRWERQRYEPELLDPIIREIEQAGCKPVVIRYGFYREEEFRSLLRESLAMVFLCEHETQGFAYLQALSSDVPLLAWDRGGLWKDPAYFPERVSFGPVTSVPYFDERCGRRFRSIEEFSAQLRPFLTGVRTGSFSPRAYVTENFDLAARAAEFVRISESVRTSSPL